MHEQLIEAYFCRSTFLYPLYPMCMYPNVYLPVLFTISLAHWLVTLIPSIPYIKLETSLGSVLCQFLRMCDLVQCCVYPLGWWPYFVLLNSILLYQSLKGIWFFVYDILMIFLCIYKALFPPPPSLCLISKFH